MRPPEPAESGLKDTVIAYPGEITRIKGTFDLPGQYVWHCHILEHEDNEMMRPYSVGPIQQPNLTEDLNEEDGQDDAEHDENEHEDEDEQEELVDDSSD